MSYAELWASMGPFAKGIVIVMFIMSAWSWAVSISKQLYLRKSQKDTRKFAPEFSRYLQEEQLDGAIALAEKNKKSHVARVLGDRKSTRLNSSHLGISYAVFCLKKKILHELNPLFTIFFFNDTATTEIYTLSLHDALPISFPSSST